MRLYNHAQTWNEIHVAIVHGMDVVGSISHLVDRKLYEKFNRVYMAKKLYAIVNPT